MSIRRASVGVLATVVAGVVAFAVVPVARADDPPDVPANEDAPVEIDRTSPQLKMRDGATLADARVIDIVQVVEDEGGEERREDSNAKTKFTLQAEVLFGRDSAKLNGEANARIKDIAGEINGQAASEVNIFGFTDNLGSYQHGVTLSRERAEAVHERLVVDLNDTSGTFNIRGYSEDYPIASNATEEGRKKNRRVEVSFPRTE